MTEATVPLRSHEEAILVLGPYDRYARLLRQDLDIEVYARAGNLRLKGPEDGVAEAKRRVEHLLGKARKGRELGVREIESILLDRPIGEPERRNTSPSAQGSGAGSGAGGGQGGGSGALGGLGHGASGIGASASGLRGAPVRFRPRPIEPRNENQRRYLETIERCPLTFGLGVAGTGKTYLAVAAAVQALRRGEVRRLIISRPVVEAGEHLGFLPGDLHQKLNPYMRPIYDALRDMVDMEDLARLEEAGVIEVAPLAYMRGRTLSSAFVILDEAQNTTIGQMKMFLTRMGENSSMVVTGDPSQNDLPRGIRSGLLDAVQRLRGFDGIGVAEFDAGDVVRHPLVARIVRAYMAPSYALEDEDHHEPERAGEARGGDARGGEARSGDARSGDARSGEARGGESRGGDRPGDRRRGR